MYFAMFLAIPVTIYTVNLHLGNYSFYQRQIFTLIFEICSLVCSSSHARLVDAKLYFYSQLNLKICTLRFVNILY